MACEPEQMIHKHDFSYRTAARLADWRWLDRSARVERERSRSHIARGCPKEKEKEEKEENKQDEERRSRERRR